MKNEDFIRNVVEYFNQNHSTVRKTAEHFGISKTAVHLYLTKSMPNPVSRSILEKNKAERHVRGGLATREKYQKITPYN